VRGNECANTVDCSKHVTVDVSEGVGELGGAGLPRADGEEGATGELEVLFGDGTTGVLDEVGGIAGAGEAVVGVDATGAIGVGVALDYAVPRITGVGDGFATGRFEDTVVTVCDVVAELGDGARSELGGIAVGVVLGTGYFCVAGSDEAVGLVVAVGGGDAVDGA
jgi:hypothetical protein